MSVSVQEADFDIGTEVAGMTDGRSDIGALVTFTGLVRDMAGDARIDGMTLEHYPGMTEQALIDIVAEAQTRWPPARCGPRAPETRGGG